MSKNQSTKKVTKAEPSVRLKQALQLLFDYTTSHTLMVVNHNQQCTSEQETCAASTKNPAVHKKDASRNCQPSTSQSQQLEP